jgi:hypothetical protein
MIDACFSASKLVEIGTAKEEGCFIAEAGSLGLV